MIGDWPRRDLVAHRAETTPERTALVDVRTDESWSYRAYDRRVDRVAGQLAALEADRVGVVLATRPSFATVVFAAMRTGTTLVPLNVRETAAEQGSKAARAGVAALLCGRETESAALAVADTVAADRGDDAVPVRSVDEPASDRVRPLETAPTSGTAPAGSDGGTWRTVEPVPLERDETLLVLFTSGTTGEPKGVRLTVGNLVASATASAFRLGVDPHDRWLCCLPMYHMGGLAPVVRSALYGTTVVLQREFDARETIDVLESYGITGVSLVPTMCRRLLAADWSPSADLRFVLLGGAPASEDLLERALAAGVPVHPTYGMTETASQIATATPDQLRDDPETVGQPLAVTDVSIVDADGDPVSDGERGELVVSGPTVTPGYLDEAQTDAAVGARGLRTGDVGTRDADGRLRIRGRTSARIVTGGENVDPGAVRDVLLAHPAVADAAVVGLDDPEWGERVAALVVPEDGRAAAEGEFGERDLESLLGHCDEHLAGFKRPKTVGVADALPRTPSGTVEREAVRERLRADGIDVADAR